MGEIPGSKKVAPYFRKNQEDKDRYMTSKDILGCQIGTRTLGNFHSRERRQVREIGRNEDIVGSKPGSLVHGIKVPEGV